MRTTGFFKKTNMTISVEDSLKRKKNAVEAQLQVYLADGDTVLSQAMQYAVLSGGKRFRPLLTLAASECLGVEEQTALPFACAIELIHNYSLVHDDLPAMDNDDYRRNQPTCHKAFGEDIALLVGDGLLTLAFEVLARAPLAGEREHIRKTILAEISCRSGIRGMISGQFLDITLSPGKITPTEFHEMIYKKTGCLILAAVKTGAFLGEASPSQIQAFQEYGRNIGLAFQTRDDILDTGEDTQETEQIRSNSVSLYGMEGAKKRLGDYVTLAINALEEQFLASEELCFLAQRLLVMEEEEK